MRSARVRSTSWLRRSRRAAMWSRPPSRPACWCGGRQWQLEPPDAPATGRRRWAAAGREARARLRLIGPGGPNRSVIPLREGLERVRGEIGGEALAVAADAGDGDAHLVVAGAGGIVEFHGEPDDGAVGQPDDVLGLAEPLAGGV